MSKTPKNSKLDKNAVASHPDACTGSKLLDDIASLFRQYLACSDDQLTVLALWSLYTWCFEHFSVAPYLDIRSPEPQCGKTVCLHLLDCVCNHTELISGAPIWTLQRRLTAGRAIFKDKGAQASPPFTFLIDNSHHIFGRSERQPLVAILNAGSDRACRYVQGGLEVYVFGPKAFAGDAPLPRSLAARCIPIVLRRPSPGETYDWFRPWLIADEADALAGRIQDWVKENSSGLHQAEYGDIHPFPPTFTPRQQDCAEPLLRIARLAGGHWPEKAYAAFTALFQFADRSPSVLMLSDLRTIFFLKNDPEYLSTRDLLAALCQIEDHPWNSWGAKSGRRLGALLQPFGIVSRTLNSSEPPCKGYLFKDLQDAWDRYLPPLSFSPVEREVASADEGNVSQTDCGTPISAIDAGSNGKTEKRNDSNVINL
jgi:putative DNA primase/helicase